MKIYFATWLLEVSQGEALSKIKAPKRLLSFWHTKEKPIKEVRKYIRTGRNIKENTEENR